jgi:hypothetical protein
MKKLTFITLAFFASLVLFSQEEEAEQDRASMAVDATASQWSFQLAYQSMPQYYTDDVNGQPRRKGPG